MLKHYDFFFHVFSEWILRLVNSRNEPVVPCRSPPSRRRALVKFRTIFRLRHQKGSSKATTIGGSLGRHPQRHALAHTILSQSWIS